MSLILTAICWVLPIVCLVQQKYNTMKVDLFVILFGSKYESFSSWKPVRYEAPNVNVASSEIDCECVIEMTHHILG